MLYSLLLSSTLALAAPAETQFDILGFSPDLNVVFAQNFVVPEDGKCANYILDLDKKIKFVLPPLVGVQEALVGAGEDEEGASCQLREFEGVLEIKLKNQKTYSADEKKMIEPLASANWKKPIAGFKDAKVASLGAFLRLHRSNWHPDMAAKIYELGATEADDKDWVDGYSAMLIAADWKPGYTTKEGRERARQAVKDAEKLKSANADSKAKGQAVLALEMAVRLDPKSAPALLALAKEPARGYGPRVQLIKRALKSDPVMTTREYRESDGFSDIRCNSKASQARKGLPEELIKDLKCEAQKAD